jgi:hypothetical protein
MTPKAWQLAFRAQRLRNALNESATITDAVLAAGFPDNSSYYRQADAALGMTARQYRRGGDDTNVCYALSRCALGIAWWRKVNAGSAPFCWLITMTHCWRNCEVSSPVPGASRQMKVC